MITRLCRIFLELFDFMLKTGDGITDIGDATITDNNAAAFVSKATP